MKLIIRLLICGFGLMSESVVFGQETVLLERVEVNAVPTVQSVEDLAAVHEMMIQQLIPIAPPSGDLFTQLNREAFPFNFKSLPDALLKSMVAKMDDAAEVPIPVYSIFVGMDEKSVLFFVEGCEWAVYRLPLDYNPILLRNQILGVMDLKELDRGNLDFLERIYNPYRFFTEIKLVPEIFYADYQEGLAIAETEALPMMRIVEPTEESMIVSVQAVSVEDVEAEEEVPMVALDAFPPSQGGTVTNASGSSGSSNQLMQLTFTPPAGFGNYAEIFRTTSLIPTNWSVVLNSQSITSGVEATWIDYASSNQASGFYIISDATSDQDFDGFSNLRESYITHTSYTNFNFFDNDNDGLHDWFETIYFGSITNQTGTNDFDADGLMNNQEWILTSNSVTWISDPTLYDTDGDGTGDGAEVLQGSDPSDPSDNGQAPTNATTDVTLSLVSDNLESTITLSLVIGTNTHSVSITTGGVADTKIIQVQKGKNGYFFLSDSGFGYDLLCSYTATISGDGIIIEDPLGLLGSHSGVAPNEINPANTGTVHMACSQKIPLGGSANLNQSVVGKVYVPKRWGGKLMLTGSNVELFYTDGKDLDTATAIKIINGELDANRVAQGTECEYLVPKASYKWYYVKITEPEMTEITCTFTQKGEAETIPWNGWYWPFMDDKPPNLYSETGIYTPLKDYDAIYGTTARATEEALSAGCTNMADGHCWGWMIASIVLPQPVATTTNGIAFNQDEMEGLYSELGDDVNGEYAWGWKVGDPANELPAGPPTAATGETVDAWVDELHNAFQMYLRQQKKPMIADLRDMTRYDFREVWNHAIYKYESTMKQVEGNDEKVIEITTIITSNMDFPEMPSDSDKREDTYVYVVEYKVDGNIDGTSEKQNWKSTSGFAPAHIGWISPGRVEWNVDSHCGITKENVDNLY